MAKVKKYQTGGSPKYVSPYSKKTTDSTDYYVAKLNDQMRAESNLENAGVSLKDRSGYIKDMNQTAKDALRQKRKGTPGFDANGFPITKQKSGGKTPKTKAKTGAKVTKTKAKDGKWIQKAVNPKHKGYCTPMTKATCTPKRKALAKTFKAMGRARKGK